MPSTDIEVLGIRACLALLRWVPVGRLVFSAGALPAVRPVSFMVVGGHIVVPGLCGWADKLDKTVVAFEADEIDERTHVGWHVVVVGKAELITAVDEDPAGPDGDRHLKVDMERVSGRRLALTAA